jgi:hypothetical protein
MPPGVLPAGVQSQQVTITAVAFKGKDPVAQSRFTGSPSIGTQPKALSGSGVANAAIFQSFGPGAVGGVIYTFLCVAIGTDGKPYEIWVHGPCTPVT